MRARDDHFQNMAVANEIPLQGYAEAQFSDSSAAANLVIGPDNRATLSLLDSTKRGAAEQQRCSSCAPKDDSAPACPGGRLRPWRRLG